jgi:HAD superfamily hydrolase (TIGR01509 family)
MAFRAVLLDLDNTLVDRDAALRAWLHRHVGSIAEFDRLLEIDDADGASLAALSRELVRLRPGLDPDPQALAARIRSELPAQLVVDPTILAALDRLADAGLRLALVSNGGPSQRARLAAAGIDPGRFATMQISAEFGRAKPDPAIFEAALSAMKLAPAASVMVGDSPAQDIVGAAALGIPSCWLAHGRRYPARLPPPTMIARDLPDAVTRILVAQGNSKSRVSASRTSEE